MKIMMRYRVPLLLLFALLPCVYSAETVDSLKRVIQLSRNDTMICSAYSGWGEEVYDQYPDSALALWITGQRFCEGLLTKKQTPEKNSAILRSLSSCLNNIGFYYSLSGNPVKALEYYKKSLAIDQKAGSKKSAAETMINIGRVYDKTGNIPLALEYYHQGLKIEEGLNDKEAQAYALNNIGFIYDNQGDSTQALRFYRQSLAFRIQTGDQYGAGQSYNNIGTVYHNYGQGEKALSYYTKAQKIQEEIKDMRGLAGTLSNIGSAWKSMNNDSLAMNYYMKSLRMRETLNDKAGQSTLMMKVSGIYFSANNIQEAISYGKKSLQIGREIGYPECIRNAAGQLYKIYKSQKKSTEALQMMELFIQMRDSINNRETRKESVKKQFQYEYDKKAAADSVRALKEKKRNAAEIKTQKSRFWFLAFCVLFVLAGFVFALFRFRESQKQKKIIEYQKALVEEKQKEVLDSIRYAKRIQQALLTSELYIRKNLHRLKNGPS